jgi:5,10-methenyltetrahydrofolate synthetase
MGLSPPSAEHPVNPTAFRIALRQKMLAARVDLSLRQAPLHATLSARIDGHLSHWLMPRTPTSIGFCIPVQGEFDPRALVTRLLGHGWTAAVPVVHHINSPMLFHPWTPETPMATDRHGIPIPANPPGPAPQIVLLPLVAFDAAGYRLGYGGGYFDRTLAASVPSPLTIGIGFELTRVASIFPQAHDQRLDFVVTEAGAYACKAPVMLDGTGSADDHAG